MNSKIKTLIAAASLVFAIGGAASGASAANIVIGSGGNLFVTNFSVPGVPGVLTVFAPGANGNVAPIQSVTRFIGPIGISL